MTTESVSLCPNNNFDRGLVKHSDDKIYPKHIKKSECMPLSQLEDLITCPIHLGMMEDPRILPCGHVFCLNCLQSCITSFGIDFRCPVCRQVAHVNHRNITSLPPSIQTKQLTDCIVQAKAKFYEKKYGNIEYLSNESLAGTFTLENKRDLVKHLIKEIADYTKQNVPNAEFYADQLAKVLECIESPFFLTNHTAALENKIVHSSNNIDLLNSNYELMDVETIRENMKKYCEYKLQRDVNNFLMSLYLPVKNKIAMTHVKLINDEPEILVWSYTQSNVILVKSSQQSVRSFVIKIDRAVLKPINIKIYNNTLFVSGTVENPTTEGGAYYYHLIQCSLTGEILHRAHFIDHHSSTQIAGFHIEQRTGKVLVALPTLCKIAVLTNQLVETSDGYHFNNLHPKFVTHNPECGEIWVTCPQDGRIVIIDEDSGSYRQLGTNQIYNAIPSDITVTSDNRVIFLDCHDNRVFWVRKRNDFILIQRISFIGHHNKLLSGRITSMHSVGSPGSNGKLLFTTANRICLVKPAKVVGEHHPKHLLCSIL